MILKFIYKYEESRRAKVTLKMNNIRSLILPDFKTLQNNIKTVYYQCKDKEIDGTRQSPETASNIQSTDFHQVAKAI